MNMAKFTYRPRYLMMRPMRSNFDNFRSFASLMAFRYFWSMAQDATSSNGKTEKKSIQNHPVLCVNGLPQM